jgi:hypothetical protein
MAAVLQYMNRPGERKQKVWNANGEGEFTALIKCYVQDPVDQKLHAIEKHSTRPATLHECYKFAEKLKVEYGANLKQLIVWNMDVLKQSPYWC